MICLVEQKYAGRKIILLNTLVTNCASTKTPEYNKLSAFFNFFFNFLKAVQNQNVETENLEKSFFSVITIHNRAKPRNTW